VTAAIGTQSLRAIFQGLAIMAFEREEIRLPGGVLTYLVAGRGNPVVYIHGDGGARESDALLRLSQERRVYIPVLPGFDGVAPRADGPSARELAQLVGGFVEAMVSGPCDIIGHSFGGWVALWLAADKPDCVDHLVLEAPRGGAASMPALADMSCVTLLLAGADDDAAGQDTARALKGELRKSYLVYVYGAGHAVAVDQPARFHGVVTDFLTWGEAFLVNRADQRTPLSREGDAAYG
jgi:pimeloyl-ACP methyl ester carboxylesterase